MKYLFWSLLCFFTIAWYIIVMLIVAYKGGIDIKRLLQDLRSENTHEEGD